MPELLNSTGDKLRLFAVWCARRAQHLITDEHYLNALNVAERHAKGDATDEELESAYENTIIIDTKKRWCNHANAAAHDAAWPSSLNAAYYASLNTSYAVASAMAANKTEYYAAAQKELEIHNSTLKMLGDLDGKIRLFSVLCVMKVRHLIKYGGNLEALDVAWRYAKGQASETELEEARRNTFVVKHEDSLTHGADIAARATTYRYSLEAAEYAAIFSAQAAALEVADYSSRRAEWWNAMQKGKKEQECMLQWMINGV